MFLKQKRAEQNLSHKGAPISNTNQTSSSSPSILLALGYGADVILPYDSYTYFKAEARRAITRYSPLFQV